MTLFINICVYIIFTDYLGISHHACTPILTTSQSFHILPSPFQHPHQKKLLKNSITNKTNKPKATTPLFCLSNTSSFILVALGAVVCSTIYPFWPISPTHKMHATNHCNESLVGFTTLAHHHHWRLAIFLELKSNSLGCISLEYALVL